MRIQKIELPAGEILLVEMSDKMAKMFSDHSYISLFSFEKKFWKYLSGYIECTDDLLQPFIGSQRFSSMQSEEMSAKQILDSLAYLSDVQFDQIFTEPMMSDYINSPFPVEKYEIAMKAWENEKKTLWDEENTHIFAPTDLSKII